MAKVFITGSSQGLGLMAGRYLANRVTRSCCTLEARRGRSRYARRSRRRPAIPRLD